MKVSVIGLGEVGAPTFEDLGAKLSKHHDVIGVEINPDRIELLRRQGIPYEIVQHAPPSDVYIIAVYTTDQVHGVLQRLDLDHKPLISIESTIQPAEAASFVAWAKGTKTDLVTAPHRYMPGDPAHRVFNLDRILGGATPHATRRGMEFYQPLMEPPARMHEAPSLAYAALSKVCENTIRYAEIVLAQNLRMACEAAGYDWKELRRLANTKWNIALKEARDGVGGTCLPKDRKILQALIDAVTEEQFSGGEFDEGLETVPDWTPAAFLHALEADNERYKAYVKEKSVIPDASQ